MNKNQLKRKHTEPDVNHLSSNKRIVEMKIQQKLLNCCEQITIAGGRSFVQMCRGNEGKVVVENLHS